MIRDQKNLKVDKVLHDRIRIVAAKRGMFLPRLVEDILEAGLKAGEYETSEAPDQDAADAANR